MKKLALIFVILMLIGCRSKYIEFHENKTIAVKGFKKANPERNTGHWMYYNDEGHLIKRGSFSEGKKNGVWTYYEDGFYMEYGGSYIMGQKTGRWTTIGSFQEIDYGDNEIEDNVYEVHLIEANFENDKQISDWKPVSDEVDLFRVYLAEYNAID